MIDPVSWRLAGGEVLREPRDGVTDYRGRLRLIDQTRLPGELVYVESADTEEIFSFIQRLVVRGAPAIGCAAALGLAAVMYHSAVADEETFRALAERTAARLAESRPTA
ncbi:MAG: hypothetical protein PHQ27_05340, partial [Victivallales bacterium]|nr:hypothetical protein [Victivallales bacterium]